MKLRWGICGTGLIGTDFFHAITNFLPSGDHEIIAVADVNEEWTKTFVEKNKLSNSITPYSTIEELVNSDLIDIVYVALHNKDHHPTVLKALRAGKHVLCEKPMGMNLKQVTEMVQCAKENERFLMEGFWSRFFPVYQELKNQIKEGVIGEPKLVMADFGYYKTDDRIGRLVMPEGGGFLMDLGLYPIQLSQLVFGGDKPTEIYSHGWLHPGKSVDNTASITLIYASHRMAQLLYTGVAYTQCRVQIVGTKGRLMIPSHMWCPTILEREMVDGCRETFEFSLPTKENVTFNYPNCQGLIYEAEHVRQCIMKGIHESPEVPHKLSLDMAEILQECRKQMGVRYKADVV